MPDVGTLNINLNANTSSFEGPLGNAGKKARDVAEGIQNDFNKIDMKEARGSVMLLGEEIGIHIPRHAQKLIAELPLLGAAFEAAFPILAVIAIGKAIFEFTEKVGKAREEIEKETIKVWESADAIGKLGDATEIQNLKLQDQIRLLSGLPAQNGPAIAADEARKKVDALVKSLDKAIEEEDKLMGKLAGNWFTQIALFSDDAWVKKLAGELHGSISFIQTEIGTLENRATAARAKLSTDKDAHKDTAGDKKELDDLQALLDAKREYLRHYLTVTAQERIDSEKQVRVATLMLDPHNIDAGQGATKGKADAEAAALQSALNASVAAELNASHAIVEIHKEEGLEKQKIEAETLKKRRDLLDKAGQEIRRMAEQGHKEQQAEISRSTNFNINEGKRQNEEKIKQLDQQLAAARTEIDGEIRAIEDAKKLDVDKLNFDHDQGILSNNDYKIRLEERLRFAHDEAIKELNIKLASYDLGTQGYAHVLAEMKKLDDQYLADKQKAEDAARQKQSVGFRKQLQDWTDVQKQMKQVGMQTLNSLNTATAQFLVEGTGNWRQLAASAIESIITIGLQYVETKIAMMIIDKLTGGSLKDQNHEKAISNAGLAQSDAALAAANTLADAPWPINIPASAGVLALGEGYAAMASVGGLAEQGAVLPNRDMLIHTHPEEMILPKHISNFIVNAAGSASRGAATAAPAKRGDIHVHLHDVTDGAGVEGMVKKQIIPMIRREVRRGRI
jgi:lambda family phage tail tape measure protein